MKKFINPDWKILRKLEPSLRQAWFYIWDKSDAIGVYEHDEDYFSIDNGFSIDFNELLKLPRTEKIGASKILLLDYIDINYVALKDGYNPHKPAFRCLEKHNLSLNSSLNQACVKLEDEDKKEDEDEGEKKKKKASKKNEPIPNAEYLEVYNDFLKARTGTSEQFSVSGRAALQKIILYLRQQCVNNKPNLEGQELDNQNLLAFKYVLANFDKWDNFHKGQLKLEQINSNLLNIINSIKNGNPKNSRHQIDPVQLAAEAINLSRESAQRRANGDGYVPQG